MGEEVIKQNVVSWTRGKPVKPLKIEIWLTFLCNLKCKFCDFWKHKRAEQEPREMTDEQLRSLIHESLEFGIQHFTFSGAGEPWLRGALLLEFMRDITVAGRDGHLLSNGTLFSEEDIREIVEIGWGSVVLSLDGPTREIHDGLRGQRGACERTVSAATRFAVERRREGTSRPHLAFNVVVTRRNWHLVAQMIRFTVDMGFDQVLFRALMDITPWSGDLKLQQQEQEQFVAAVSRGTALAERLGVETNLGEFSSPAPCVILERCMPC